MENPFSDSNRYLTNRFSPTSNPPLSEMIFGHRLSQISESEEQQPWPLPNTVDGFGALRATPSICQKDTPNTGAEERRPPQNGEQGEPKEKKVGEPQKFIVWYGKAVARAWEMFANQTRTRYPRLHPAFLGLAGLIYIVILLVALLVHFEVSKHSGAKHRDQPQAAASLSSISTASSVPASSDSGGTGIVPTITASEQSETVSFDTVTTYTVRKSTLVSSGSTTVITTRVTATGIATLVSSGFETIVVSHTDTSETITAPEKTSTTMYVETEASVGSPSTVFASATSITTVPAPTIESSSSNSVSMTRWTATTIIESPGGPTIPIPGASSEASGPTATPVSLSTAGVHNLIEASIISTSRQASSRGSETANSSAIESPSATTASETGISNNQASSAQPSLTESSSASTWTSQIASTQPATNASSDNEPTKASSAIGTSLATAEVHNLIDASKVSSAAVVSTSPSRVPVKGDTSEPTTTKSTRSSAAGITLIPAAKSANATFPRARIAKN